MPKKFTEDNLEAIGEVFTPPEWVRWALIQANILEKWTAGASIFEPTAGAGNFLLGLIDLALERECPITKEMVANLYANERRSQFINDFFTICADKYEFDFPETNFFNQDILYFCQDLQVDILIGNPPWCNFNDLPLSYKQEIRPLFYAYDLVGKSQELLLGNSRADLAFLVLAKTLQDCLKYQGYIHYFLPLSAFLNDGAGNNLRSYSINQIDFCVEEIFDFKGKPIFEHVNTRYGFVSIRRDMSQIFPIRYWLNQQSTWQTYQAQPLFGSNSTLAIAKNSSTFAQIENQSKIVIAKEKRPRQGVNSCGAKDIFIFDQLTNLDAELVEVSNCLTPSLILPRQFLFPLITKQNFNQLIAKPSKYVLVPYDSETGKPISWHSLQSHSHLLNYLLQYQDILSQRKGKFIRSLIQRDLWWALLGVGKYSFSEYKVGWQAYGQKTFRAKVFEGKWQGNQAMHAYISTSSITEAETIAAQLNQPWIEEYLQMQQMAGTCNWAQPGRIMRILELV